MRLLQNVSMAGYACCFTFISLIAFRDETNDVDRKYDVCLGRSFHLSELCHCVIFIYQTNIQKKQKKNNKHTQHGT